MQKGSFGSNHNNSLDCYSQTHQMCGKVKLVGNVKPHTRLYHHLGLAQFIALVESGTLALRQVKQWVLEQDAWEQPIKRIDVINGTASEITQRYYDSPYGHSWSRCRESDAMWRIYSREEFGIQIMTTAEHFRFLGGIHEAVLAPVYYTNEPFVTVLSIDGQFPRNGYADAFLKRVAFKHENEVRLIVLSNQCDSGAQCSNAVLRLPLDPQRFIKKIILDPRANEWYVDAIRNYCKRIHLKCVPIKSGLYSENALDAGLFSHSQRALSQNR